MDENSVETEGCNVFFLSFFFFFESRFHRVSRLIEISPNVSSNFFQFFPVIQILFSSVDDKFINRNASSRNDDDEKISFKEFIGRIPFISIHSFIYYLIYFCWKSSVSIFLYKEWKHLIN